MFKRKSFKSFANFSVYSCVDDVVVVAAAAVLFKRKMFKSFAFFSVYSFICSFSLYSLIRVVGRGGGGEGDIFLTCTKYLPNTDNPSR